MNDVINALKTPFVALPPEEQPSPKIVALVWGLVGVLVARTL